MSSLKLVTIFGATGGQGGSVVKSILSDPKSKEVFKLRGITRDTSRPAAKKLEEQGVETVAADMDDADSLRKALQGSFAVFAVTNYWEHLDQDKELKQGKTIVDICKEVGVQHLIFSVLKNVTELTNGEYKHVYHFDSKAKIADYIKQSGVPYTNFMPGFYMSNLVQSINPGQDGNYAYYGPYAADGPIPLFAHDSDSGKFVKAILLNREKVLGKNILAATDYYTPNQIAQDFEKATGKPAKFIQIPEEAFKGALAKNGMPEFVQNELYENMMFMAPYGYYGKESLDFSHSILSDKLTTFVDFAKAQKAWQ